MIHLSTQSCTDETDVVLLSFDRFNDDCNVLKEEYSPKNLLFRHFDSLFNDGFAVGFG